MAHTTKQRLLDVGLAMLLEHGYNDLGIQALLAATRTPKGSFYHHFKDKQDFALQVIDQYMRQVHAGFDVCLAEKGRPPLERVRRFFELTQQAYRKEGYMGCLLGGLGQELSGVNEVFRRKIEGCFTEIAARIAVCLEQARKRGDIPADSNTRRMASLLVDSAGATAFVSTDFPADSVEPKIIFSALVPSPRRNTAGFPFFKHNFET